MKIKELLKLYKEKRIKKISDRMFEIDKHIVIFQKKKGRKIITCDCLNHSKFCNTPIFCWHKEIAINYPIIDYFSKKINDLKETLKFNKEMKKNKMTDEEVLFMVEDLW